MRFLMAIGMLLVVLAIGCDNLPIGGKCYDHRGNELPYVVDSEGTEWKTEKATINSESRCSIPIAAVPFRPFPSLIEVQHPNGAKMQLLGRHEGKWVINAIYADWY